MPTARQEIIGTKGAAKDALRSGKGRAGDVKGGQRGTFGTLGSGSVSRHKKSGVFSVYKKRSSGAEITAFTTAGWFGQLGWLGGRRFSAPRNQGNWASRVARAWATVSAWGGTGAGV